jgi:methionine synthase I (cobalamin-dependent)
VIETDTFGANRIALARHGLADQMARSTRPRSSWPASAPPASGPTSPARSGPTGVRFAIATESERRRARIALAEQIDTLVIAGVD